MLWLIWDILVPLALAFLSGLFCGWLLWRWRRMRMTADELAAIKRSSARYKSDADTLRSRNAELAERLRAASGAGDSTTLQDLATANRRVDKLRDQLKQANRELASLRQAQPRKSNSTPAGSVVDSVQSSDRVRELEGRLSAAHEKIQSLEASTGTGSVSALRAVDGTRGATDLSYLEEEIVVRDKMIATLRHSLEQYGEQQDTTALMAELELREQRITVLENLLSDAKRVA